MQFEVIINLKNEYEKRKRCKDSNKKESRESRIKKIILSSPAYYNDMAKINEDKIKYIHTYESKPTNKPTYLPCMLYTRGYTHGLLEMTDECTMVCCFGWHGQAMNKH